MILCAWNALSGISINARKTEQRVTMEPRKIAKIHEIVRTSVYVHCYGSCTRAFRATPQDCARWSCSASYPKSSIPHSKAEGGWVQEIWDTRFLTQNGNKNGEVPVRVRSTEHTGEMQVRVHSTEQIPATIPPTITDYTQVGIMTVVASLLPAIIPCGRSCYTPPPPVRFEHTAIEPERSKEDNNTNSTGNRAGLLFRHWPNASSGHYASQVHS